MPQQTDTEATMEQSIATQILESHSKTVRVQGCEHRRMIDEVLGRGGKRTGKVRCLECGTIIDDPHQNPQ